MAENKKSFIAYADWKQTFDQLPDEYAGKLIKHMFAYVNDENPTTEDFIINAVFANIKSTLKRDLDKWETQLNQRKQAGKRSAEIRSTKSNDRSNSFNETTRNSTDNVNVSVNVSDNVILLEKETKNIFVVPTVFQISEYCRERKNNVDPNKFFDFYESKGWLIGKNKMKDWKAAVRTWEDKKQPEKKSIYPFPKNPIA